MRKRAAAADGTGRDWGKGGRWPVGDECAGRRFWLFEWPKSKRPLWRAEKGKEKIFEAKASQTKKEIMRRVFSLLTRKARRGLAGGEGGGVVSAGVEMEKSLKRSGRLPDP